MEHNLLCFKRTSTLTALSLPREYREGFYTKSGVWTKLIIIKGKMKFVFLDEQLQSIKELNYNKKTDTGFIEPNIIFRISPTSTDLQFHIEFYCEAQDYFFNKYDLGTAHPEVVNAMDYLSPCKVLDLGDNRTQIIRIQGYPGWFGKIFTVFFGRRESGETAEYLEVWGNYAESLEE